jgi:hypothetical protein
MKAKGKIGIAGLDTALTRRIHCQGALPSSPIIPGKFAFPAAGQGAAVAGP